MGVSRFLISCARRRATLAPGLALRYRDDLGKVVEHHQARACGITAPRTSSVSVLGRGPARPGLQLVGLLPLIARRAQGWPRAARNAATPAWRRLSRRPPPRGGGHGRPTAATAGCAWRRVDRSRSGPRGRTRSRRRSGCRGWSAGWRARLHLAHAALHQGLLASASCSVMSAKARVRPPSSSPRRTRVGRQVAVRLSTPSAAAAAAGQLVAHVPASSKTPVHREDQRQRERADVHLAQGHSRASAAGIREAVCTTSALWPTGQWRRICVTSR